jgi:putative ABC transport system permease protein
MARAPLSDRLFRLLLRLFPSDFRSDFGDNMRADFRDQRAEAEGQPQQVRTLWARTVLDLVRQAPREHLDVFVRDASYALRVLRRHPLASATAVLSLAIGIGLNSAVYSVVGNVLWRSLPFADSDRLVSIGMVTPSSPQPDSVLVDEFLQLHARVQTLEGIAAGAMQIVTIAEPGEPAQTGCLAINPEFFDVFKVRPIIGAGFSRADYDAVWARRGPPNGPVPNPAVMLLSDRMWRTRFGADPDVVGKSIRLAGGDRIAIVGVMGPDLETLGRVMPGQCWFPDVPDPAQGTWRPRILIGRLAPGRTLTEANAELAVLSTDVGKDPFSKEQRTLRAVPVLDRVVGRVRTQLIFLFGAVVCVLLVTCANVVNLFLAHAAGRRDELATRVALGASRGRLVRQVLTESLLISLLGGACGFLLTVWTVPALVSFAPRDLPRQQLIAVDWSTFAFTLGVSLAVGIACGLLASMPTTRVRTLFGAVQAATTPRVTRLRQAVTVCEIALALMLAVAASLMVRTVQALNAIDLGFDPIAVVAADLEFRWESLDHEQDIHMAVVERVKAMPGVTAAGIGIGPLSGGMGLGGLVVPGDSREFPLTRVDAVSPGYFEALGVRLLAGRFFEDRDAVRGGRMLILVNQTAARLFWKGADPLDKVLRNGKTDMYVVGVIADLRGSTLEEEPEAAIYQLANQSQNFLAGSMLIRVDGDPKALVPAIREVIRSIDRDTPFSGVTTLQSRIDRAMAPRLFVLRLIGLFSVLGLVLAVVGVYGVLAEFVVQRVPEIGVRMAFGATARDVIALVLGQGSRLVLFGLALGLGGAVMLRGAMNTLVYSVRTSDPLAYVTACVLLFAATVAACALPARRASRLDPAVALRSE